MTNEPVVQPILLLFSPKQTNKPPSSLTPGLLPQFPRWCCWSCYQGQHCQHHCRRSWTGGCWHSWRGGSSWLRTDWSQGCSWEKGSVTSAWQPGWCFSRSRRHASGDCREHNIHEEAKAEMTLELDLPQKTNWRATTALGPQEIPEQSTIACAFNIFLRVLGASFTKRITHWFQDCNAQLYTKGDASKSDIAFHVPKAWSTSKNT